jgi:hypothetical protein
MPLLGAPAPGPVRTPLPTAPPGWLISRRRSAWKAFEECAPDADWAEPVEDGVKASRRKVIKIQCDHRRRSGNPARALARGTDERLDSIYATALIMPCQYTKCPNWVAYHPNEM